jgi:hypothetical protein
MQLGIGKTLFPAWAAAGTLVKDHGVDAYTHARDAVKADTGSARLDHAVLAMTSFDHAIDNTRKLPVSWFVGGIGKYYRGYEAAKQAVTLLVASGLVPAAKEKVGRQSLIAAKDAFLSGVEVAGADRSRFGRAYAGGWLEATAEDALTGAMMLPKGSETGRALLAGINQVRSAVDAKRALDPALVKTVSDLFDRAGSEIALLIARAGGARTAGPVDTDAFERSGELLRVAQAAAEQLVKDAPDVDKLAADAG